MGILCTFGFHNWDGCKCTKCSKIRDEKHNWKINCEMCSICNKKSGKVHQKEGCRCINCDTTFHTVKNCICLHCQKEFHEFDYYKLEFNNFKASVVKNFNACKCKKCGKTLHKLSYDSHECMICGEIFHQYIKVGEPWKMVDPDWDIEKTQIKYRCKICGNTFAGDA